MLRCVQPQQRLAAQGVIIIDDEDDNEYYLD
jgi:hypothetical protein